MSKRNIVNNLNTPFSLKYYVEDSQGDPTFVKEITINTRESQVLDELVETCWLKFTVHKKDGCTVTLSGKQSLELITVKSASSGGPNTETVVKISAKQGNDDNYSNEDDDVVVDTAEEEP